MLNPPFVSDVYYAVQNEDYRTELAVLRRIRRESPKRVLIVASSGENALSLLTDEGVGVVDAVDLSAAQIHLLMKQVLCPVIVSIWISRNLLDFPYF